MKKCGQCKSQKEINQFCKSQLERSGGICRECNSSNIKKYKQNNPDKIKKYYSNYYLLNKSKILNSKKSYYKNNKKQIIKDRKHYYYNNLSKIKTYNKLYYVKNKKEILNKSKQYSIKNFSKISKYRNKYLKIRRMFDIKFRLKCSISANINFYLKSHGHCKNNKSTLKYLPYSIADLKNHLEKHFEAWMTWENYGKYNPKSWDDNNPLTWTWQIDHIVPHSTFKYSSVEDNCFKQCWSLNNLRPLSSKKNFIDGINRLRH